MSLRPKTRSSMPTARQAANATDAQIRRARKNASRSAPTPPARTTTFSKVVKAKKSHLSPIKPNLAQQLSDQLDDYRDQLYESTEDTLKKTESSLTDQINELGNEFSQQLTLLSTQVSSVARKFAEETVGIPNGQSKIRDGQPEETVRLADLATDFHESASAHRRELRNLFLEWNTTQRELIMLAVQVLGPEAVVFPIQPMEELFKQHGLRKIVDEATTKHEQMVNDREIGLKEIEEIEKAVKELSRETNAQIDVILKEYKTEQKRRKKLCETAQQYLEGWE